MKEKQYLNMLIESKNISDHYIQESFAWQPTTVFVHKLIKYDKVIEERLQNLVMSNIISDFKNIYIYSFVHPDIEYCMSLTSGTLVKGSFHGKAWNTYLDPLKLLINKRMIASGISLEKISDKRFTTNMFLSSGRSAIFQKIAEIPCDAISTTVPLITIPVNYIWENFRVKLDTPNKLKVSTLQFKRGKIYTLPQIFTKGNYIHEYTMIAE